MENVSASKTNWTGFRRCAKYSTTAIRDKRTVIFCDPDPVLNFQTQSKSNRSPKS